MNTDYLADWRRRVQALETRPPLPPWSLLTAHAVGGLEAVGFEPGTDLLLVVSSQGRGVFDCLTGARVARDREAPDLDCAWYDDTHLAAEGIGPLAGKTIRLAGLYGGGLPRTTVDNWSLTLVSPIWPDNRVILSPPFKWIYDDLEACVQVFKDYGEIVLGFSDTGASFIVATSSDVTIFRR